MSLGRFGIPDFARWWELDATPHRLEDFAGRVCYAGLDEFPAGDLLALALVFPDPDERHFDVVMRYWMPSDSAVKCRAGEYAMRLDWSQEGWITATPGAVVDYGRVRADLGEIGKVIQIKEIAADHWSLGRLMRDLQHDGLNVVAHRQGILAMGGPTKELGRCIDDGLLRHGGNPVLAHAARHAVCESDAAGNVKISETKGIANVCGMVALTMALGRACLG